MAIGLSANVLALLGRAAGRLVLDWYDVQTGKSLGTLRLAPGAEPSISVADHAIVFRVGLSIRAVDVQSNTVTTVAKAAATPVGLSIAGDRVAWAENVRGRGRIRAVTLPTQ